MMEADRAASKTVGMARFHYPHKIIAREKSAGTSNPFGPAPAGSKVELCEEFFEKLELCELKHLDREQTYCMLEPCLIKAQEDSRSREGPADHVCSYQLPSHITRISPKGAWKATPQCLSQRR